MQSSWIVLETLRTLYAQQALWRSEGRLAWDSPEFEVGDVLGDVIAQEFIFTIITFSFENH